MVARCGNKWKEGSEEAGGNFGGDQFVSHLDLGLYICAVYCVAHISVKLLIFKCSIGS